MEVIWCHPIGGETLVTDGRVDDRLVWWSWHSKLSAWLSVRVSQVVISVLLAGRRVVMEDVQSETIWPSRISGDKWMWMISSMAIQPWMESRWSGGMRQKLHYITHMWKYSHSRGGRKRVHLHIVTDPYWIPS